MRTIEKADHAKAEHADEKIGVDEFLIFEERDHADKQWNRGHSQKKKRHPWGEDFPAPLHAWFAVLWRSKMNGDDNGSSGKPSTLLYLACAIAV